MLAARCDRTKRRLKDKTKGKKMSNTNEKITITRAELYMFASAYGNKVQASEADFAISLFVELLKRKMTIRDVAAALINRSKRHQFCAMMTAELLPQMLRDMVEKYVTHDDGEKLELAGLAMGLNK